MSIKETFNKIIYKISPVKKGRVVFTSFNGHYSDNPKYISIMLNEKKSDSEIIWLVDNKYREQVPQYAQAIDISSLKAQWYKGSAEIHVDNVYCDKAYTMFSNSIKTRLKANIFILLSKKKGQKAITTFHGTPLKRIGRDQVGNNIYDFRSQDVTMILGNQHSVNVMKRVTYDTMKIELMGSPRNDIFFKQIDKINLKKNLGLPIDKKIVLYAPTFRNDGKDVQGKNVYRSGIQQLEEIDVEELLSVLNKKFDGEWVLVCRFHYHIEKLIDWNDLSHKYNYRVINGNLYDDMAEYLACTDFLLTDSSSSVFDFALTKKPCVLYFPDYENYKCQERGFYFDIKELPFPLVINFEELVNSINCFNLNQYQDEVEVMLGKIGSVDDGGASERIVRYILEKCQ